MSQELVQTANALVAKGKGILAADESFPTIAKRFKSIDLESTEENRRDYRHMLFTAPEFADYVSGVILFDETLRQNGPDGKRLAEVLSDNGVIPGIKVDKGAKDLAGFAGEKVTEGLDGLRDRLKAYYELGARFAKWRAVIDIAPGIPTAYCLEANAHGLARYAALCQEANIVPIVEPEVLMDGDHDLARCQEVTEAALTAVFAQLNAHKVLLEGMLLKPNMVISGKKNGNRAGVQEVAAATVATLKRCVPSAVPGIVFLSGGQSSVEATAHLDAMNKIGDLPWALSFSYGRALQEDALQAWKGSADNVPSAQKVFNHRAKMNGAAAVGEYSEALEAGA
ncbi:class I fructose-bisphosphate aldolase [Acanthopleuribacter pedis]|uniref:Fructose-bisphosphate aldolase n=1 Tax=Acanthopleuribacter pedis TaxID=442870 RepID=A0A8J7QEP9_9BACT|nr:class I fructose-bisphosphate aldolase [Acanthopleuribacter pedis]MBO1317543.1 fructose-bisphosphate aldolase class I [Acanthopleuribacter pedis]